MMFRPKLVGLVGSFDRPSKTSSLVDFIGQRAEARYWFESEVYDLADFGPSLGHAQRYQQLDRHAQQLLQEVIDADALVIGLPAYKESYPGLFNHLIDQIGPLALKGKPVILSATVGSDRHPLMTEHQLRPLLGLFAANFLPSFVYASDRDFLDCRLVSEQARQRVEDTVSELAAFVPALADVIG